MYTLYIQALGSLHVSYNDQTIPHFNTPKLQSVLAYLLLQCQTPQTRYHTAAILWPTSTDSQARTNLRKYIHQLRYAIPNADGFLCINGNTIQWQQDASLIFDVAEFEQTIEMAKQARQNNDTQGMQVSLATAVGHYRGDLFPDCYDDWIQQPRQRLSQTYTQALSELALLLERERDYETAIHYLQRLLHHDPLREAGYRQLMRLYALNGDRGKALQAFEQCRQILEQELGVPPSHATQTVYERLIATQHITAHRHVQTNRSVPLVGRQTAWEKLQTAWDIAINQKPHFVSISGVAGIGKTRLAEEFLSWAEQQGFATATTRTYAVETPLAYAPLISWLRTGTLQTALPHLDDVWLTELARLLPEVLAERPELPRPEPLTENWHRQRLFEAIGQVVLAINRPLILFIDDLQWSDEQTLAWLHYLMSLAPKSEILVLGTLRPEEAPVEYTLSLLDELRRSNQLTEITLDPLNQAEAATLADYIVGRDLNASEKERLYQETEGNPLFIVEMLRAEPSLSRLPETVQAVIKRRLHQLSPEARALVDLAAVTGRDFSLSIVTQASQHDEERLVATLDELSHRYLIREQGGDHYDFTHDKIREVAYRNLSQARRRFLHRRVAEALEALSHIAEIAAKLAYHYTEAGKTEKVVRYRLEAGQQALALCAYREASEQLQQGLDLLNTLPHTPDRDKVELEYLMTLASVTIPLKGFTAFELNRIYDDAAQLAHRTGNHSQSVAILHGLAQFYTLRGQGSQALAMAEQCLAIAQTTEDPAGLLMAHTALGNILTFMGMPMSAAEYLKQGLAYYELSAPSKAGRNLGILCQCYKAIALWLLGYPDQSLETAKQTLMQARLLQDPHRLAAALFHTRLIHLLRQEPQLVQTYTEETIELCITHGFTHWLGTNRAINGWSLIRQGDHSRAIKEVQDGLNVLSRIKVNLDAHIHMILAEANAEAYRFVDGLRAINHAIAEFQASGFRGYESMAWRIKGNLMYLNDAPLSEVEDIYKHAIAFAQTQEAKSFELQATIPLCRLYQQQGKIIEARQMLDEIYGWFTEGFDTPDLREARALLDELT